MFVTVASIRAQIHPNLGDVSEASGSGYTCIENAVCSTCIAQCRTLKCQAGGHLQACIYHAPLQLEYKNALCCSAPPYE